MGQLIAGSTEVDITPRDNCFLWGYPHVDRISTGVHDPLMSASLYLSDGNTTLLIIANDLIFVSKDLCRRIRHQISSEMGIPAHCILISATHTHSGPTIVNYASNADDPIVPLADEAYLDFLVHRISEGACESMRCSFEAEMGITSTRIEGIGTNRLDPKGPADEEALVAVLREKGGGNYLSCMIVYGMHPTVLHGDSTLISADFPGIVRQYLKDHILGPMCPVLYHNGVCGNVSPRHTARSNTIEEMKRLGVSCAKQIEHAFGEIAFHSILSMRVDRELLQLRPRNFPAVTEAEHQLKRAIATYSSLENDQADRAQLRTAECAVFGAEETLTLAKAAETGGLLKYISDCLPAEIGLFRLGDWTLITWPGELFVEYALELKERIRNVSIISMANGELQGYIVTSDAVQENTYEAANALFSHLNGLNILDASRRLIERDNVQKGKKQHA